jgi:hypothetical protein
MPPNRSMPTRPSPPPVDITTEGVSEPQPSLPSADNVVAGGETADGVPFLIATRGQDGNTYGLATTPGGGVKPRQAAKADASSFREMGSASPSPFVSSLLRDPNTALAGQAGVANSVR